MTAADHVVAGEQEPAPRRRASVARPCALDRTDDEVRGRGHQEDQQRVGVVEAEHQRRDRGEGDERPRDQPGGVAGPALHSGVGQSNGADAHQRLRQQHRERGEAGQAGRGDHQPERSAGLSTVIELAESSEPNSQAFQDSVPDFTAAVERMVRRARRSGVRGAPGWWSRGRQRRGAGHRGQILPAGVGVSAEWCSAESECSWDDHPGPGCAVGLPDLCVCCAFVEGPAGCSCARVRSRRVRPVPWLSAETPTLTENPD